MNIVVGYRDFINKNESFVFFVVVKDINEYQFGQYECRGTNNLGEKSDYVYIQQSN